MHQTLEDSAYMVVNIAALTCLTCKYSNELAPGTTLCADGRGVNPWDALGGKLDSNATDEQECKQGALRTLLRKKIALGF